MSFIKLGEPIEISRIENTDSCIPAISAEILENFSKYASNLKRIAPKAEDFLYFSAVMMHAAEASAINDDGSPKLTVTGEPVKVSWDNSDGTWRWVTNDPSVKPYKNSNGDIFPASELVKAYKKWIHKPLCIDHKSNSVDHVRGFIVDTYYDHILKRVIALCALDKHNYPDLARKVATGYSSSVSMGTAVGRAICSDCARVAKTEADFCDHMRRKSCYGEINVDLNPIELSIVVNGADPKAHIKHIMASAEVLNNYVDNKATELKKMADNFTANISFTHGEPNPILAESDNTGGKVTNINITSSDLDTFKQDVDKAISDYKELQKSLSNEGNTTNDSVSNQSLSADSPFQQATASLNNIEAKLSNLQETLNKLSNIKQEENMSGSNEINKKGYYQGTEEPAPGQVKYPKDPTNDKLRTDGDKHMEGQMDTGPVEGMHPGTDSSGMSELERKKMLARAESEDRAMRRNAAVALAKQALERKKEGYFQNGEGPNNPNTPTPGKVKYPAEKLNEDLRDEDKHMVGQKPFPGVGPVDGMHPSPASADVADEKKRKEMLSRAALRARFVKASNDDGSQNLGKSAWEVFLGDKLLLTASVDDLSGNRSDFLYDTIATKEFGSKLMEKVKVQGAEKVAASFVKKAQDALPPPPADAAPAPEGTPELPAETADTGKSGDPTEALKEMAEKVRDLGSDMVEVSNALTGEQAEMGNIEGVTPEMAAAAGFDTASLNAMRKDVNKDLLEAFKDSLASLNDHKEELDMIIKMYNNNAVNASNEELVGSIVEDALNEAKTAVADGFKLMTAFIKYARGTKAIVKRAEMEAELEALAEGDNMAQPMDNVNSDDNLMDLLNDANDTSDEALEDLVDLDDADEAYADENDVMAKPNELKDLEVKPGTTVEVVASQDFDSKEGRAALRAKLAADTLKVSPMLHDAHPKGGVTTELDVKPSGDLAKVEDLEEIHDRMMDVANAPPKVRKEAQVIHKLISEGTLNPADLDALVAEGLDKDAVAYYKKYYSQADGGSEFASELVKEHVKAQLEEELNTYKVKLGRAYELAYDMVDRGLCPSDRNAVTAQVEEIMQFNDESFDSLKRVVAKHAPVLRKEAGRIPQVGMIGSGEVHSSSSADDSLYAQLSAALSKTSKKMF